MNTLTVTSVDELLDAMPHMLTYVPAPGSLTGVVKKGDRTGYFVLRDPAVNLIATLAFLDEHQPHSLVLWGGDEEAAALIGSRGADLILATDTEWWRLGEEHRTREATRMAAELVLAGAPLAAKSREERLTALAPPRRFNIPPSANRPRKKYDEAAERRLLRTLTQDKPLVARSIVAAMNSLSHVYIRDTLLWDLIDQRDDIDFEALKARLIEVAVEAPRKAPAFSILAIVYYVTGDGALANESCRLALVDDPDYRLATLVSRMMAQGSPPNAWMDSITSMTRRECNGR